MFIMQTDFSVKILSVLLLEWEKNIVSVPPHLYHTLSFRIQGDAHFTANGIKYYAGDKTILHVPTNIPFSSNAGHEKVIVVRFQPIENHPAPFQIISLANTQRIEELFLSLWESWESKQPGHHFRCLSLFYRIMELIEKQTYTPVHTAHYEKIRHAVEYLQRNYRDPNLSIGELCNLYEISDTYFRKRFYEEFHITPSKYLTNLRIDYAKDLLENGMCSIEQMAEKSGFCDPKYFCTVFKKATGQTPSEFRKNTKFSIPSQESVSI